MEQVEQVEGTAEKEEGMQERKGEKEEKEQEQEEGKGKGWNW